MAVMARSLGLPSRIATGFAPGTLDTHRGVYQVYQNNAHTWPEIYFPQYGWVQFEPTASEPVIARPLSDNTLPAPKPTQNPADTIGAGGHEPAEEEAARRAADQARQAASAAAVIGPAPIVWAILLGLSAIAVVAVGGLAGMWWYENRQSPRKTSGGTWAFARLTRLGSWLRVKLSTAHTPFEQAQLIGAVVPQRQSEIDHLADLYVRERYGRAIVDAQEPRSIWRRIHWSLWRAGLKRRVLHRLPAVPVWLRRRPRE
jgi:hypothetical protein